MLNYNFLLFVYQMSGKINIPVFTELDEERYKIWFERLEKSYKVSYYVLVSPLPR